VLKIVQEVDQKVDCESNKKLFILLILKEKENF